MGNRDQRSNKQQKRKALLTPKEKKAAKRAKKDAVNTAKNPSH